MVICLAGSLNTRSLSVSLRTVLIGGHLCGPKRRQNSAFHFKYEANQQQRHV